jgi:hypothetical protein
MDTALPINTVDSIISPTSPAVVLSLVVVPTMPPVVGLKVKLVAVAAPRVGVTNEGLVVSEIAPLPLTFAANAVATPVPKPDMPVLTGSPVQFVKVPDVGVPRTGVVKLGLVVPAKLPVPDDPESPTFTWLFVAIFLPKLL